MPQNDENQSVRHAAQAALNQINLPEVAARALIQASEEVKELGNRLQANDESDAATAAKALGEMGPRGAAAAPALALALRHKSKWVREAAAKALGRLNGAARDFIPALQSLAQDPEPEVRAAAEDAMQQVQGKYAPVCRRSGNASPIRPSSQGISGNLIRHWQELLRNTPLMMKKDKLILSSH